jgi:hypothetical protein
MGLCVTVAVVGATTRVVFETFVEWILVPTLSPVQVVVMDDNLGVEGHRRSQCPGVER